MKGRGFVSERQDIVEPNDRAALERKIEAWVVKAPAFAWALAAVLVHMACFEANIVMTSNIGISGRTWQE